jgi:ribosome-associated protein
VQERPSDPAGDDLDTRSTRPSKSAAKREMTALQKLGVELVDQTPERLARVEMPENLRDAIEHARSIRDHEGRRRQMQYIGRLMRDVDPEPIRAALASWTGQSRAEAAALHALERWRERLIEDDEALTAFAAEHTAALAPDTLQRLRQAVRGSRKERSEGKPPHHYRELFRLIRAIVERDGAGEGEADA